MKRDFKSAVLSVDKSIIRRVVLEILQVNMGTKCNQHCAHCHINAGPEGDKIMSREIMDNIVRFLSKAEKSLMLDITGGSPELNPDLKYLIERSKPYTKKIVVRNNLTIFFEKRMEGFPEFYKNNKIKIICSMPCYTRENVEKQRGRGVFDKSIKALKLLNELGYGKEENLELDLVYNPGGAFLPGDQGGLEKDYKKILYEQYGIVFNHLLTITNVPINRFRQYLEANGILDEYMELLMNNFNRDIVSNVMCRNLLSVGWDGTVYDCDFNQALRLAIRDENGEAMNIRDLEPQDLEGKEIIFKNHCHSCTAGTGSSCSGTLKKEERSI